MRISPSVAGLICISPTAPFEETALTLPPLSTCITARIHAAGIAKRSAAAATNCDHGSSGPAMCAGVVWLRAVKGMRTATDAATISARRNGQVVLTIALGDKRTGGGLGGMDRSGTDGDIGSLARTAGRAGPDQMERVAAALDLKQAGADELTERRVVDEQRDIIAGLVAGALPSRSDFDTCGENAVIRRVVGVARLRGYDDKVAVEHQGADGAGKSVCRASKGSTLCHGGFRCWGWVGLLQFMRKISLSRTRGQACQNGNG